MYTDFASLLLAVLWPMPGRQRASQPADTTEATLIANERVLLDAVARWTKTSFSSLFPTTYGIWTTKTAWVMSAGLAF